MADVAWPCNMDFVHSKDVCEQLERILIRTLLISFSLFQSALHSSRQNSTFPQKLRPEKF